MGLYFQSYYFTIISIFSLNSQLKGWLEKVSNDVIKLEQEIETIKGN